MKVGDYVRTPYGIRKVKKIIVKDNYMDDGFYVEDRFIICGHKAMQEVKSSPNIIDLIEEDDILKYIYNQKEYVSKVINRGILMLKISCDLEVSLGVVEIKSIVTREQFSNMEYRIGG